MSPVVQGRNRVNDLQAARNEVLKFVGPKRMNWVGSRGVDGNDVFLILGNPDKDGSTGFIVRKSDGKVTPGDSDPAIVNRVWKNRHRIVESI